ncbi:MAG: hypothetical protein LC121_01745 [Anaerolineae bacterium]|nr:hypothetical protein [Anaerolineae bacterium]
MIADRQRLADSPQAARTPRRVESGPSLGYVIRRARKAGRCDYWLGERGRCTNRIEAGDEYVEGELSDNGRAGGYGRDRWCMSCAMGEQE